MRPEFLEVPCRQTMGHGDSCSEGHLCTQCAYILRLEEFIRHEGASATFIAWDAIFP